MNGIASLIKQGRIHSRVRVDRGSRAIKTRPDTRAKTVRRALLILRSIPSSIRPIPSSIQLTVDEYDNE